MDSLIHNATHILRTAVAAGRRDPDGFVICVTDFNVRILEQSTGWSLPALAADMGARAVYKVERRFGWTQVEAWSCGRSCVIRQESTPQTPFLSNRFHAISDDANWLGSTKDLVPWVRNSNVDA